MTPDIPQTNALPDANDAIPMLTDIVGSTQPRYAPEQLPAAVTQVDWAALAERVRDNVGERLIRRTQALLDTRLRDTLHTLVERTTATLNAELSASIEHLVRELVDRAVTEELSRLHTEITRRRG